MIETYPFGYAPISTAQTDGGPDTAPPEAGLAIARHLGRRVAAVALQLGRGRAA
jgi:NAD(P)H dehydrogenase (quinone)